MSLSHDLARLDPAPFARRRERLRAALAAYPGGALIPAGLPSPRNYAANTHDFRAGSHFLYLVGLPLAGATLFLDEHPTLFVDPPAADDALWHGPLPSMDELAARTGLRVRPRGELAASISPQTMALAAADAPTRAAQTALLGRAPGGEADLPLIDGIIALRLVHDEHAIAELRQAAEISVAAHRAGRAATRAGVGEHAVHAAMVAVMHAHGSQPSYTPIVSRDGHVLHNHSYANTLADGDLLLADVGAESHLGFAGDITRTWPVSGEMSPSQRAIFDLVARAQADAIALVRPGTRYRDVHLRAARTLAEGLVELEILRGDPAEIVEAGVHALFFPHGIGHLLGLDVHDMEDLGDRAGYAPEFVRSEQFGLSYLRLDRVLEAGMAVTIEPGFYQVPAILAQPESLVPRAQEFLNLPRLADFADVRGIRIEDDVLVTEGGHEVLTAALPTEI